MPWIVRPTVSVPLCAICTELAASCASVSARAATCCSERLDSATVLAAETISCAWRSDAMFIWRAICAVLPADCVTLPEVTVMVPTSVRRLAMVKFDRVGDGAGEILGDVGVYGEVAVGKVGDVIEQLQNCFLLAGVAVSGFAQLAVYAEQEQQDESQQAHDRQRAADVNCIRQARLTGGGVDDRLLQRLGGGDDVGGLALQGRR